MAGVDCLITELRSRRYDSAAIYLRNTRDELFTVAKLKEQGIAPGLMLVSAFAGRELIGKAYQEAIAREYRFYSFGDAVVILSPKPG